MDKDNSQSQPPPSLAWLEDEDAAQAPVLLGHLKALAASPGWEIISKILDRQAAIRTNELLAVPLGSLDGALEQEYKKGEAIQLLTLRGLPTVLIEELSEITKRMREDAERTDSNN